MNHDLANNRLGKTAGVGGRSMRVCLSAALLTFALLPAIGCAAAPRSESAPIADVVPELSGMQKWNDMAGDTADPFWADDDNLYHFTCDGRGFGKERRNLCLNKLTGSDLKSLKGELVNPMDYGKADENGPDGATWKVAGQECIDGVFYAFVARNTYGKWSKDPLLRQTSFNASLIKSTDHGLNWTRPTADNYKSPMWPGKSFGAPCFIHYGKNGGQVKRDKADQYVYAVSNNGFWNGGDLFVLGRVRRADLPRLNAADWSYYSGGDGMDSSAWTPDLAKAKPILEQPAKLGLTAPVFIPALNRYLLVSWYITPTLKRWFTPELVTFDFYEAPHPWGPWKSVASFDDTFLPKGHHMYGPNLCAKYQEVRADGVKVDLYTSGCPFQDVRTGLYKNWRIPLLVKTTPPPPATEIVNDDNPAIKYTGKWTASPKRGYNDYNDDVHYSNTPGDAAEFIFTGTGVQLLSEKFYEQGQVDIFIDGQARGSVNLKQDEFPRLPRIPVFSAQGLPAGQHTIRIVNTGKEYISIDAFVVSKTASK